MRVLLVEQDAVVAARLAPVLAACGHQVTRAGEPEAAALLAKTSQPAAATAGLAADAEAILVIACADAAAGAALCRRARARAETAGAALLVAIDSEPSCGPRGPGGPVMESLAALVDAGADDILTPPWDDAAALALRLALAAQRTTRAEEAARALRLTQFTLDRAADAVFWVAPDGRFFYANEAACSSLGMSRRELLAKSLADIAPSYSRELFASLIATVDAAGAVTFETEHRHRSGELFPVEVTINHLEYAGREFYCAFARDIAERKRVERAQRESEERFRALVQNATDLIAVLAADGTVRYESPSHQRVLGRAASAEPATSMLALVHPDDRPQLEDALLHLAEHPEGLVTLEYRSAHADGSWRVIESTGANLLADPAVAGIVFNSRDVTDRRRAEEKLLHDAFHDELTGLPNRALFMDRLGQAMATARARPGEIAAVLFLDVDRFKIVNDSLGHPAGDELLVWIAATLTATVRPVDLIARVGGDEFTVLLAGSRDAADVVRIAERIQEQLATPLDLSGHEVFVTASIGIAIATAEHQHPADLLRDADTAMYRAKASGRACHVVFNRRMHRSVLARLQVEADLRRGIERGELRVLFQPFVAVRGGQVVGFEALVRWQHPQRGLLAPDDFLPVAEETGLIVPLGRLVMNEACRQVRELAVHAGDRPLTVSVNLSNRQFFQTDLFELVERALADSGLDPALLGLEITEGVIIRQAQLASSRFKRLKELGVKLYLDDFGKGYSSLNYLHRFPIDILKIDRSFVARIEETASNVAIVEAIVHLAHQLHMEVVGEGVQTRGQLAKLAAIGCEYGQGHLFAPPIDFAAASALVADAAAARRGDF